LSGARVAHHSAQPDAPEQERKHAKEADELRDQTFLPERVRELFAERCHADYW